MLALYLLFAWLVSAAAGAWLTERKGYGERAGLMLGLILPVAGLLLALALPARAGSKWRTASTNPSIPAEVRSSRRMCAGSECAILAAIRFTRPSNEFTNSVSVISQPR